MDSDGPLKVLFQKYAQDLLSLTGDEGARVESAGPAELNELKRQVDCVLTLKRDGERYYRHLEFQSAPDPDMATRCFRYNTQLILQYGAAVITTVLYLLPPKPKREPVFRVSIAGREVNRWTFEEICLFELDARTTIESGVPGLIALVPLMGGGRDFGLIEESLRRIERAYPEEALPDAENVLLMLAGQFYTVDELSRVVGRDRMRVSSLYTWGQLEGTQHVCAAVVRKHHPAIFDRVQGLITGCQDTALLERWTLAAPELSDSEFLELVGV